MTAQDPDELILDGQILGMIPPPFPGNHPRIFRPVTEYLVFSTGCWRGYIGTWEIIDGCLYLIGVRGDLAMVGGIIPADWVTGTLVVRKGKCLRYVHAGFASVYEQEIHIEVEEGKVLKSHTVKNTV